MQVAEQVDRPGDELNVPGVELIVEIGREQEQVGGCAVRQVPGAEPSLFLWILSQRQVRRCSCTPQYSQA